MLVSWGLSCAAAFVVAMLAMAFLNPIAAKVGLVDRPGGRKDHAAPTPVSGGLAVAIGILAGTVGFIDSAPALTGLGLAAAIILIVGVLDDLMDLHWAYRVFAQATAAAALIFVGDVRVENLGPIVGLSGLGLGALAIPFTMLATIGLINALNMCDGVDGLAGGLGLCALVMLAAAAAYSSNLEMFQVLVVAVGALLAFLAFNMRFPWQPRAKAFLGNSGSALLGLFVAWASFRLTQNPGHPVSPILAPFLIAPPVIDCLVLIARRVRKGVSPFAADRGHMHHLLLDSGCTPTMVVAVLCSISLALGLVAALCLRADVPAPWFLLAFAALTLIYFGCSSRPERVTTAAARVAQAGTVFARRSLPSARSRAMNERNARRPSGEMSRSAASI